MFGRFGGLARIGDFYSKIQGVKIVLGKKWRYRFDKNNNTVAGAVVVVETKVWEEQAWWGRG